MTNKDKIFLSSNLKKEVRTSLSNKRNTYGVEAQAEPIPFVVPEEDKVFNIRKLTRSEMLALLKEKNIHWGVTNKNRYEMVQRWEDYINGSYNPGTRKHFKDKWSS